MPRSLLLPAVVSLLLPLATPAFASSSGVFGYTAFGCGGGQCHGTSPTPATTLICREAEGGTSILIAPGSSRTFTVSLSNPTTGLTHAGVNIAVKTTVSGSSNGGTLAVASGQQDLRRSTGTGEIAHERPRALVDGGADFQVTWTAPTTEGIFYLRAAGNAVNRDGQPSSADKWNVMVPVELIVSNEASVADGRLVSDVQLTPLPAHDHVTMTVPTTAGESFAVTIVDQHGRTIATDRLEATSDVTVYAWNGRTSSGQHAPSGTYVVMLEHPRRTIRGRAILLR